jgi:hypothetical protein
MLRHSVLTPRRGKTVCVRARNRFPLFLVFILAGLGVHSQDQKVPSADEQPQTGAIAEVCAFSSQSVYVMLRKPVQ